MCGILSQGGFSRADGVMCAAHAWRSKPDSCIAHIRVEILVYMFARCDVYGHNTTCLLVVVGQVGVMQNDIP
jgi:hypothetical protein